MNNIEILEDYIDSLRNGKPFNYTNERKAQAVENLIQEYKELKEYKKIAELTKVSCCTAQNCEALNNAIKNGLENEKLLQENKELKEEKVLNEKILYFANNTLCNYQEGYQAGLHKEITATEIVAEEREKFIIAQEIKRLKDTIHELHNQLDEGNKRVKENYIPKTKVKEKIEELDKEMAKDEVDEFGIHSQGWAALDWTRDFLLKLLEEGE